MDIKSRFFDAVKKNILPTQLLFPNRKHDYLQGVAEYIILIVQQLGWQFDVAHNKTVS